MRPLVGPGCPQSPPKLPPAHPRRSPGEQVPPQAHPRLPAHAQTRPSWRPGTQSSTGCSFPTPSTKGSGLGNLGASGLRAVHPLTPLEVPPESACWGFKDGPGGDHGGNSGSLHGVTRSGDWRGLVLPEGRPLVSSSGAFGRPDQGSGGSVAGRERGRGTTGETNGGHGSGA